MNIWNSAFIFLCLYALDLFQTVYAQTTKVNDDALYSVKKGAAINPSK